MSLRKAPGESDGELSADSFPPHSFEFGPTSHDCRCYRRNREREFRTSSLTNKKSRSINKKPGSVGNARSCTPCGLPISGRAKGYAITDEVASQLGALAGVLTVKRINEIVEEQIERLENH